MYDVRRLLIAALRWINTTSASALDALDPHTTVTMTHWGPFSVGDTVEIISDPPLDDLGALGEYGRIEALNESVAAVRFNAYSAATFHLSQLRLTETSS